jgi:hypothetical protein
MNDDDDDDDNQGQTNNEWVGVWMDL